MDELGYCFSELKYRVGMLYRVTKKNITKLINKNRTQKDARGRVERQKGETMGNQSTMIIVNEEGNVARLILLIRLSIPPQRPNPRAI